MRGINNSLLQQLQLLLSQRNLAQIDAETKALTVLLHERPLLQHVVERELPLAGRELLLLSIGTLSIKPHPGLHGLLHDRERVALKLDARKLLPHNSPHKRLKLAPESTRMD